MCLHSSAMPGSSRCLGVAMLLYMAASLLHFAHNAEYLSSYPNLPSSLTRVDIYLVCPGLAAMNIAGYVVHRRGQRLAGLCLLGAYAVFGFDGLLHYIRAPFEAHTAAMNFTIWFEVLAAALLLVAVITNKKSAIASELKG